MCVCVCLCVCTHLCSTVKSGYPVHAPDGLTTAICALDNGTHSLASNVLLTQPLIL